MSDTEASLWCQEFCEYLKQTPHEFGVFVDMRSIEPLTPRALKEFEVGQKQARDNGMVRSVVILSSSTVTYQFKRTALRSGIYDWERYIDESSEENWEQIGLDWVIKGIDPDARRRQEIAQRREKNFEKS